MQNLTLTYSNKTDDATPVLAKQFTTTSGIREQCEQEIWQAVYVVQLVIGGVCVLLLLLTAFHYALDTYWYAAEGTPFVDARSDVVHTR